MALKTGKLLLLHLATLYLTAIWYMTNASSYNHTFKKIIFIPKYMEHGRFPQVDYDTFKKFISIQDCRFMADSKGSYTNVTCKLFACYVSYTTMKSQWDAKYIDNSSFITKL